MKEQYSFRVDSDVRDLVKTYAVEKGIPENKAWEDLARTGLAIKYENLYAGIFYDAIQTIVRKELSTHSSFVSDLIDSLSEDTGTRLSKAEGASYAALFNQVKEIVRQDPDQDAQYLFDHALITAAFLTEGFTIAEAEVEATEYAEEITPYIDDIAII